MVMAEEKLQLLKEKLDEQGLGSDQWKDWLDNASMTLWAVRQVLKKFEPYAKNTIAELSEAEDYLDTLADELEEVTP